MNDAPMIEATGLEKTVRSGDRPLTILMGLDFVVEAQSVVAIRGPSGSGKSTLLGLLAGLDLPTGGRVQIAATDLATLDEEGLARFRSRNIGFVFQAFHLLPNLTALENAAVPLEIAGDPAALTRAAEVLDAFGLTPRAHHLPSQMSGGEQQRVAIARAISNRPRLVLADEPTGNLDEETGARIADLLLDIRDQFGATIVVATHDSELAARADRRLLLRGGALAPDRPAADRPAPTPELVAT